MVHPFEATELGDVSGVRRPARVVGIHEPIVLLQEYHEGVLRREESPVDRQHTEDTPDRVIGTGQVNFRLE